MIQLLVLADDFTGALDTGVQFGTENTVIRVIQNGIPDLLCALDEKTQVVIIDTETRHVDKEKAASIVAEIVRTAVKMGIPHIYKKTDSALRGNIGAELSAMLLASEETQVHFVPAYPKMNRTTIEGIHYINGVPVAQSIFGEDPFEPVVHSDVKTLIALQSNIPVRNIVSSEILPNLDGIMVYDAATDQDMYHICKLLSENGIPRLVAGCAGFAAVFKRGLELTSPQQQVPCLQRGFLTICGSLNPITQQQISYAERNGIPCVRLTTRQRIDPEWAYSDRGMRLVSSWATAACNKTFVIASSRTADSNEFSAYCLAENICMDEARQRISDSIGAVLVQLLKVGLNSTILITGGDTLFSFMRQIKQQDLHPICEMLPGVALFQIKYDDRTINMMSKSGGFGDETLLLELDQIIAKSNKEA